MHNSCRDILSLYIVVPAYNERQTLGCVLQQLSQQIPPERVIVVDDASGDDTAAIAESCGATVLRHVVNRGQGAALATGIQAALQLGAKYIVTFDADAQHRADDLPIMIQPLIDGSADVVLGTRFSSDQPCTTVPLCRRILLKLAVLFTRASAGLRVTDAHNGFRAMTASAAAAINIRQDRMEHASEILEQIARHRLRYVERPVQVQYTDYSMKKGQKNRDAFKILAKVLLNKVAR